MDYSFEKVKDLYDRYAIGKSKETGQFVVYEKGTNNVFDFNSELANDVKFAYAWVHATRYGQSVSSPDCKLTIEDYKRAFDENSKLTYETIMSNAVLGFQSFGRMYRPEALKNEVKDVVPYVHASDIVDGLFEKENAYKSFEQWCIKASGVQENINNIHR